MEIRVQAIRHRFGGFFRRSIGNAVGRARRQTGGYSVQMSEAGFFGGPNEIDGSVGNFEELQYIGDVYPVGRCFRIYNLEERCADYLL